MTGIPVGRRLGNARRDPVPSRGKAKTGSITLLAFAGEVGPINLRKVHDRSPASNTQNRAPSCRATSTTYEKRTKAGDQQLREERA